MSPQDEVNLNLFIESLAEKLTALAQATSLAVVGVTEGELEQLRQDQAVENLPTSYSAFMQRMGRSAGGLLVGTDAFYPVLLGAKGDAMELLEADGVSGLLPPDAFVFALHQGYQIYWFQPSTGSDPAVYRYQEGDRNIGREWSSFTDYLRYQCKSDLGVTFDNEI